MTRREIFIQSLSDREMAFLYTYKYQGYFDDSRTLVDAELKKRGLDKSHIQTLLEEQHTSYYGSCRRCGSRRYMETEVEKWNTNKHEALDGLIGRTSYTEHSECLVCGLVLYDGNEPNSAWPLHTRIWRAFASIIRSVLGGF
jgi:hypothetical protein